MGNCQCLKFENEENIKKVSKIDFRFEYVIGRGGFGKVWKVVQKKTQTIFAMKEMLKARVVAKRSVHSVINEKKFLSQLYHPFLVNMNYAFDDRENLFLVIDMQTGGDLRYHLAKHRKFSEEQTKFFIACMLLGLEYIHQKSILHRDIKPENLVFNSEGYLKITDLGIARVWSPNNSKDTSGTPGYMAPEVMCKQPHGVAVDYFAMGVIGYECMFGRRPYVGKGRKEIREEMLAKQIQIKKDQVPKNWSIEAADFFNRLIQRKPLNRLGLNGPQDVKNHPWLIDFPWDDLMQSKIKSPFIPPIGDNFEPSYTNSEWKDQNSEQINLNMQLLDQDEFKEYFKGYYHDENFAEEQNKEKEQLLALTTTRQGAHTTVGGVKQDPGARNDSSVDSSQSHSQQDQQYKFQAYQKGSNMMGKSSGNDQFKKTDQTSSMPQSQEQLPRSKKYKIKAGQEYSDANSNSGMSGSMNGTNHNSNFANSFSNQNSELVGSNINQKLRAFKKAQSKKDREEQYLSGTNQPVIIPPVQNQNPMQEYGTFSLSHSRQLSNQLNQVQRIQLNNEIEGVVVENQIPYSQSMNQSMNHDRKSNMRNGGKNSSRQNHQSVVENQIRPVLYKQQILQQKQGRNNSKSNSRRGLTKKLSSQQLQQNQHSLSLQNKAVKMAKQQMQQQNSTGNLAQISQIQVAQHFDNQENIQKRQQYLSKKNEQD